MFAIHLQRLLWKEYRTQRALWLWCLALGVFVPIFVLLLSGSPGRRDVIVMAPPTCMAFMYAAISSAMLFALEREERTSRWLQFLSVPPGAVVVAKILFVLSSVIALQAAFSVEVILIHGSQVNDNLLGGWNLWSSVLSPVILMVPIWAVLGSLLSRRVMTSIATMVFGFVITFVLPLCWWGFVLRRFPVEHFEQDLAIIGIILILCVAIADFWLAWRWSRGQYLDGSIFGTIVEKCFPDDSLKEFVLSPRLRTRNPAFEPEDSWRRTWQRLVWIERHRDGMHLMLLIASCCLSIVCGLIDTSSNLRDVQVIKVAQVFWFVLPLLIGIVGFESDITLVQIRFLSHRGISPSVVWAAKQFVWMLRAFWISAVAAIVLGLVEFHRITFQSILQFPHFQSANGQLDKILWYVLLSYCCGQLISLLVQRVVLTICLGLALNGIAWYWLCRMVDLSVPLFWSVGCLAAMMLGLTLWQMKRRLLEDHSWVARVQLAAALIAAPVLLLTLWAWHRVAEVDALPINPSFDANLTSIREKLSGVPAWTWEDPAFALRLPRTVAEERNIDVTQIVGRLKADANKLAANGVNAVRWNAESDQRQRDLKRNFRSAFGLSRRARRMARLDEALQLYLVNLELGRAVATGGSLFEQWQMGDLVQSRVLEFLVDWANHPSQTPGELRSAIQLIEQELNAFPAAAEAIMASYLKDVLQNETAAFSTGPEADNYFVRSLASLSSGDWSSLQESWERVRQKKFSRFKFQVLLEEILKLDREAVADGDEIRRDTQGGDRRATESFPGLAAEDRNLSRSLDLTNLLVQQRRTMVRAAVTRLHLIAYRLEHGQLPTQLAELMSETDGWTLIDPWTKRLFEYYPTFLISAGPRNLLTIPNSPSTISIGEKQFQYPFDLRVDALASKTQPAIRGADQDRLLINYFSTTDQFNARVPLFLIPFREMPSDSNGNNKPIDE